MDVTTTTQVKELLNLHLKNHPEYESWMVFDDVKFKEGIGLMPGYKSPQAAGVDMPLHNAHRIYGEVCADIIKLQS